MRFHPPFVEVSSKQGGSQVNTRQKKLRSAVPMRQSSEAWEDPVLVFATVVRHIVGQPSITVNDRLKAVLRAACTAFEMDCGFVSTINENGLQIVTSTQDLDGLVPPKLTRVSAYLINQVIDHPAPLLIENMRCAPEYGQIDLAGRAPNRYIAVPILFDGRVFGVIELSSYADARAFGSCDLAAVHFMAATLATPLALLSDY